jgi:hypothetical protein
VNANLLAAFGKLITLTLDGLTNVKHKGVFNAMACIPLPYFVNSFVLGPVQESGVNLVEKVREIKLQLETDLSQFRVPNNNNNNNDNAANIEIAVDTEWPMFWALCSDNPSVMRKVRRLLAEDKTWIPYGCSTHGLHLLTGDVLDKKPFRAVLRYTMLYCFLCL